MLDTLVLSITYRCPIQCRLCGVHAGPHRKGMLSLETIQDLIDQIREIGTFSVVVFTGGEPTLLGNDLILSIEYAAANGFLTRIVTNAYWATSPSKARRYLGRLQNAGLTELNFSVDDFHQEHIPLQQVRWACEAAAELGIPVLLAAKGIKESKIHPAFLEEYFGDRLVRYVTGEKLQSGMYGFTYGVTVPVGWSSERLTDDDLLWPKEPDCWKGPCRSILKSVVVNDVGNLSVCCGIGSNEIPETVVGNIHERSVLDLIVEANNDLIINWLALEGPIGIMNFVRKKSPLVDFRKRYVSMCHACHDVLSRPEVRRILMDNADEAVPVLGLARAWLENHRPDPAK